ncbi:MAG: hypothetical protein ACYCYF_09290, partial [Anaerolineae bacterium]
MAEMRHSRVLREQLIANLDPATASTVVEGLGILGEGAQPEARAAWAAEAMRRLDTMLDEETRMRIREGCACVQSNEKSVYAREFRRLRRQYAEDAAYLTAVVSYLDGTRPLRRCGEVTLVDGVI